MKLKIMSIEMVCREQRVMILMRVSKITMTMASIKLVECVIKSMITEYN